MVGVAVGLGLGLGAVLGRNPRPQRGPVTVTGSLEAAGVGEVGEALGQGREGGEAD